MNTKLKQLLAAFGVLGVLYAAFFTDWFRPAPIAITTSYRTNLPKRYANAIPGGTLPVAFALDGNYRLSQVKVYEAESDAGKSPKLMWSMKKKGFFKSLPTRAVMYGAPVPGMTNYIAANRLEPGKQYRLTVESGRHKGETTFEARAIPEGMDISPDPVIRRPRRRNESGTNQFRPKTSIIEKLNQ